MERRLTAIVAADVVDYSLLLSRNEAAMLTALTRLRQELIGPAVAAYGGRVFRIIGDGSLFEFGSALNAVEFAVSVQTSMTGGQFAWPEDMPPLQIRMGVALGDVIVDEGDVHGDGVNIAARLEALAPPGGICISGAVFQQIKPPLSSVFEAIGARQLKNIAVPVSVWRWQPEAERASASAAGRVFNGRQILDPKVTNLIIDLHMRSALLAASETFDELVAGPDEGRNLPIDVIYSRFGERLSGPRHMLSFISVESDAGPDHLDHWRPPSTMSEFIAGVFDDSVTAYALKLLPLVQVILQSNEPLIVRRRKLMTLLESFVETEMAPRTKKHIKYAFVDI